MKKPTQTQIANFVRTVNSCQEMSVPAARLPADHPFIKSEEATVLKSYRHNLQALAFDSLGNMIALHDDGYTRQHIGEQEINTAMGRA